MSAVAVIWEVGVSARCQVEHLCMNVKLTMDVELVNLIKIIFPDNSTLPANWKENPDIAAYLVKLGSFGLENLTKEPQRLTEGQAAILQQTQNVAFENYKTFIHSAECSREIFKDFNTTEHKLDSLINKIPDFTKTCEDFIESTNDINLHRRLNSLTLTRNADLLEILELPQLMDTCIRNGNYEEALELAGYVRRLGKKHSQIPLIGIIVSEVEQAWLSMLHTLLSQLRSDIQLPKCLQVVGYLRRMEIFSEAEIRLKFLQARDSWLQSLLAAIPKEDTCHHLSKTIELSRVHLFNIVTQYRAIFSDEDPMMTSSKYQAINECTIFYSWITAKISQFLAVLKSDLDQITSNALLFIGNSVLGQCMYFGLSFSRVGADFRGLLAPIFVRVINQAFEHSIWLSTKKFQQDMEQFSLTKTQPNIVRSAANAVDQDKPPQPLLEFYPLADYCNGILTSLNELRLCSPIALASATTTFLQDSLVSVGKCTLTFYRQEQQALTKPEKKSMARFCAAISNHLIPHLQKCLHMVYPPTIVANHLGITVNQMKEEGLTYFDYQAIMDPITHLLPVSETQIPPLVPIDGEIQTASEAPQAKTEDIGTGAQPIQTSQSQIILETESAQAPATAPIEEHNLSAMDVYVESLASTLSGLKITDQPSTLSGADPAPTHDANDEPKIMAMQVTAKDAKMTDEASIITAMQGTAMEAAVPNEASTILAMQGTAMEAAVPKEASTILAMQGTAMEAEVPKKARISAMKATAVDAAVKKAPISAMKATPVEAAVPKIPISAMKATAVEAAVPKVPISAMKVTTVDAVVPKRVPPPSGNKVTPHKECPKQAPTLSKLELTVLNRKPE